MPIMVEGMKMPEQCEQCPIFDAEEVQCGIIGKTEWIWADDETCKQIHPRPDNCPLVEVSYKQIETNMYDQEEIYHGCTVHVLSNSVTDEVSIGWWRDTE